MAEAARDWAWTSPLYGSMLSASSEVLDCVSYSLLPCPPCHRPRTLLSRRRACQARPMIHQQRQLPSRSEMEEVILTQDYGGISLVYGGTTVTSP
jgi:hypothetical protein